MCWYEHTHTHTHIYICVYIVQLCIWCYIYIIYNIWCYIYIHSCTIYTYIYKTPDTQLHNCILLKCTWKNWVKGPLLPDSSHLFIFFWWDWGLNSRLHTFYHLNPNSSSFCSGYFVDGVSWTICLGWLWTPIFPVSASQVVRITGICHWCPVRQLTFLKVFTYWGKIL
jgi:hypothetical protein